MFEFISPSEYDFDLKQDSRRSSNVIVRDM